MASINRVVSIGGGSSDFPAMQVTSDSINVKGRTYDASSCANTVQIGGRTVHYSDIDGGRVVVIPGVRSFTAGSGSSNSGSMNGVSYKTSGARVWIDGKELAPAGGATQQSTGGLAKALGWLLR